MVPNAHKGRKMLMLFSMIASTLSLAALMLEGFTMPSARKVKKIDGKRIAYPSSIVDS